MASKIQRGGDYQSIDFGGGYKVWDSSHYYKDGYWDDSPMIDLLEEHAEEVEAWIREKTQSS